MFAYFQEVFSEMGNITSFVTLAVTILGAVSLLLSNFARYVQAKRYGLPIKAVHQASVADSADLWIILMGAFGFGFFVPIALLNVDIPWPLLFIAVTFSCFFSLRLTKNINIILNYNGKRIDQAVVYIALASLVASAFYLRLHDAYYNFFISEVENTGGLWLSIIAAAVFGAYFCVLIYALQRKIRNRLLGLQLVLTTEIDGQTYLVAMRHNQYQWFLVPCEIEHYQSEPRKTNFGKTTSYTTSDNIIFTPGESIIRDMSTLEGKLISRYRYNLKEAEEEKVEGNE